MNDWEFKTVSEVSPKIQESLLSKLVIDNNNRIFLPDFGNIENASPNTSLIKDSSKVISLGSSMSG